MECEVTIKGTNDIDVATALAYVAGFKKGTRITRTNNIWHKKLSSRCAVAFHQEKYGKVERDFCEAMLLGPDIVVSQVHERPEGSAVFQPTNKYLIDFNEKIIDKSLIPKIEEEIRLAYSQREVN